MAGRDDAINLALIRGQLIKVVGNLKRLSKVAGEPNFPVAVMIVGVSGVKTELRGALGEVEKIEAALRQPQTG